MRQEVSCLNRAHKIELRVGLIDHFVGEKDGERLAKPDVVPPVDFREPLKYGRMPMGDEHDLSPYDLQDLLSNGFRGGLLSFSGVQTCVGTEVFFTEREKTPR